MQTVLCVRLLVITAKLPCYYEQSCQPSRDDAHKRKWKQGKYSALWAKVVFNEPAGRTTLGE